MDFKAARLCVDDQSFLNFSWSCAEVAQADSTGCGQGGNDAGAPVEKAETVENGSKEEKQEDPADPQDGNSTRKKNEDAGIFGKLSNWVLGKSSEKIEIPKNSKRHYVFVVDCSGSMSGTPIEVVQETLISFFEMLEPTDLLSIVTFENTARRVFHCRTQADSAELNGAVQKIRAGGGTNLCSGLVEGMKALDVSQSSSNGLQNVMVLLSDGCANVGITRPSSIAAEIQADADRLEAVVYSIGIGNSYNNTLLNEITTNFAGVHYHVESSENIPYVIGNIIGDIQPVLFKDVTLTLLLPPSCVKSIQSPVHLTCQKNSSGVEIRMRSLRARDSHNLNLRLNDAEISNLPNPLSVQVQAKDASTGVSDVITREVKIFDVEDNNPDHDVYRSNLARLLFVEGTRGESSEHSVEKLQELKQTLTKIPRASENATVTGVLDDVDDLVDSLQNVELRGSFDYVCSNAQNMHSKGRGLKSKKGAFCSSAYESPAQQATSMSMSAKVRGKRAAKHQNAASAAPAMTGEHRRQRNKAGPAQSASWGSAPFFEDRQQHYDGIEQAIQIQQCQEPSLTEEDDAESPEDQQSV